MSDNTCRHNVIDNRTLEFRENGTVPCDAALGGPNRRAGGGSRLDIIRDSFRKSP
jgi:hypothetical protein